MPRNPKELVSLVHHTWTLPALARLARAPEGAGRLAQLGQELEASRGGLVSALDVLEARGWIEAPERHGHPLRPEFRLTERGRAAAGAAHDLHRAVVDLGLESMAYRKWTLPVLAALEPDGSRFGEIAGRLPDVTDRALSRALKRLEALDLAERRVPPHVRPPVALYRRTERGERLRELLDDLLRAVDRPDAPG